MNICRYAQVRSGAVARARAELTIASDRLDCSQEELRQMRKEIGKMCFVAMMCRLALGR